MGRSTVMNSIKEIPGIFKTAVSEYFKDKAARLGAGLAYYATFSIAPMLVILIGVAGLLFGQEAVEGHVFEELQGALGSRTAETIQDMLANVREQDSGLLATILGLAILLIGATGVFVALEDALLVIWGVELKGKSGLLNMLKKRGIAFLLVLGSGFLLTLFLILSSALSAAVSFFGEFLPGALQGAGAMAARESFMFVMVTLHFAMIYKLVPAIPIKWRDVWVGAAVTAALFLAGLMGIEFYLSRGAVKSTLGAGSSLVILLIWVYYSAQVILFGAEFTKVFARRVGSQSEENQ